MIESFRCETSMLVDCSLPVVYYTTRTHKQLEQVVKEFRRTVYCGKALMTILSSRDNSCLLSLDKSRWSSKNDMCRDCTKVVTICIFFLFVIYLKFITCSSKKESIVRLCQCTMNSMMKGILTVTLNIKIISIVGRSIILPLNRKGLCCLKDSYQIFIDSCNICIHTFVCYTSANTQLVSEFSLTNERNKIYFSKTDQNFKKNPHESSKRYFLLSLVNKIIK